jgi:hypothetical protein
VRLFLGIDPGLTGAVAAVNGAGQLLDVFDMPVIDKQVSATLLAQKIVDIAPAGTVIAIENVASMPGQGVASTFKFGRSYGVILGVTGALQYPTLHPTATAWKKSMGLNSDKDHSRKQAVYMWPEWAKWFELKKHDGRAEAAILARWCVGHAWEVGNG